MSDDANYVLGLIDSAETPEQIQFAETMLLQLEAQEHARSRFICRTLQEVAEFFSVSVSTVKGWRVENPAMPGDDGGYDLREIVHWRIARQSTSPLKEEKQRQEIRLNEIRVETQQIELDKLRGSLVPLKDVEEWAAAAIIAFKTEMMRIPAAVAQLAPIEHQGRLELQAEEYIIAAMASLRNKLEQKVVVTEEKNAKTPRPKAPRRAKKTPAKKPTPVRRKRNRST